MTPRLSRVLVVAAAVALMAAPALDAQAPAGQPAPASANPVSDAIREAWSGAKRNLTGSATTMPEDKYGFKPVASVRTYGEILAHVAGANYVFCAAARGEASPHAEDAFEKTARSRAQILKALDESVAYCDRAYSSLTDQTGVEAVGAPFGGGRSSRVAVLMGNTGHVLEHYGNLVTYLRINGLVPPSSRQP